MALDNNVSSVNVALKECVAVVVSVPFAGAMTEMFGAVVSDAAGAVLTTSLTY